MQTPIATAWQAAFKWDGIPEVTQVNYDLLRLRITLRFESHERPLDVIFDDVRGFRLLDEGDLLEFWDPSVRQRGWLWRIESGGWVDLERRRAGFISGLQGHCLEYLVSGVDHCVSVLSTAEPRFESP